MTRARCSATPLRTQQPTGSCLCGFPQTSTLLVSSCNPLNDQAHSASIALGTDLCAALTVDMHVIEAISEGFHVVSAVWHAGLHYLWRIVLDGTNKISARARDCLVHLHSRLAENLAPNKAAVRSGLLRCVMMYIHPHYLAMCFALDPLLDLQAWLLAFDLTSASFWLSCSWI